MAEETFHETIQRILKYDQRYRAEAYAFVSDAVSYTVRKLAESRSRTSRHIRGNELIKGTVEFAELEFGPMAWTVFSDWGVKTGPDVGEIVYNLIREHILSASSEDSIEDFNCIGSLEPLFRGEDRKQTGLPDHPSID